MTINEPFFQGRFPGHPIMPGVLQLGKHGPGQRASTRCCACQKPGQDRLLREAPTTSSGTAPCFQSDTLTIETEILKAKRSIASGIGSCIVNGQVVSEAELMFSVVDR
ncbi:MAG: hypothetical protein R3F13_09250 [Prosthecobacter sp.]